MTNSPKHKRTFSFMCVAWCVLRIRRCNFNLHRAVHSGMKLRFKARKVHKGAANSWAYLAELPGSLRLLASFPRWSVWDSSWPAPMRCWLSLDLFLYSWCPPQLYHKWCQHRHINYLVLVNHPYWWIRSYIVGYVWFIYSLKFICLA